ncbi:MAG: YidC/Oxa1 family insertase periplasmic-domain containing protein, partial [Elusimicrobia bacterium]|nr:YidC/Oxa1 family insertase periplasmic-domain containing protein [Elusimicrobiota bacterium]
DSTFSGAYKWIGVDNHHFLAALIPPTGTIPEVRVEADRKIAPSARVVVNATLKPGEKLDRDFLVFVGPKKMDLLDAADHDLRASVNFGTFGVIAQVLLRILRVFDHITGNWGWAIVMLTLLIQLVMYPLTKRSLLHSVKMKELQPHLKKLQEQYKDDPKRYQIEMMNFYRKNGMKFMGLEGCFPMLLQLPIFYAFYATLNVAYDLRGAAWIFWIQDLASKDPHYILPILMGAGMFLQQKTSGMAADPAQARMMMFMPAMFTFMFLQMPAGLVLYWWINSLTTMGIQKVLSWKMKNQPTIIAPA